VSGIEGRGHSCHHGSDKEVSHMSNLENLHSYPFLSDTIFLEEIQTDKLSQVDSRQNDLKTPLQHTRTSRICFEDGCLDFLSQRQKDSLLWLSKLGMIHFFLEI